MIEAQIICCNPCDLRDLGIVGLRRGEERWITVHAANSSQDLIREQRKGNVRVYRKVRRERAPKLPQPPFVASSRGSRRAPGPGPAPEHDQAPAPSAPQVDTSEIADKVREDLLSQLLPGLREAISQEVSRAVSESQPAPPPQADPAPQPTQGFDAAQLEEVLERVVSRVAPAGGSTGGSQTSRKDSGPEVRFIPKTIVDKNTKGKITVNSSKSEGADDLDSAQDALRALKRAGRGRKKGSKDK